MRNNQNQQSGYSRTFYGPGHKFIFFNPKSLLTPFSTSPQQKTEN